MNACASAMIFRCELCQDRRQFFSATLKRSIRCPCCNRRPRQDTSGLRAIAESEAERRQRSADGRMILRALELSQALTVAEHAASRATRLHPLRAPVDRIMQRWAAGEGSGLPYTSEEMEARADIAAEQPDTFSAPPARPPQLDDESQIVVDRTVRHAPKDPWDMPLLIRDWYVSPAPVHIIAEDFGVSRRTLYRYWHDALDHLRSQFELAGCATLLRLIRTTA